MYFIGRNSCLLALGMWVEYLDWKSHWLGCWKRARRQSASSPFPYNVKGGWRHIAQAILILVNLLSILFSIFIYNVLNFSFGGNLILPQNTRSREKNSDTQTYHQLIPQSSTVTSLLRDKTTPPHFQNWVTWEALILKLLSSLSKFSLPNLLYIVLNVKIGYMFK